MNINKSELVKFRADFANAVKELEAKYKIKISDDDIRFSDEEFSMKITAKNLEIAPEAEKDFWNINCRVYGLEPEDFGKTVIIQGKHFKISGINIYAPKNCIKVTNVNDGTEYTISAISAKIVLGKK
jgi:flagellar capping protein FliD